MFSPIFPCPLDSLWAKIQDGRHFRGKLVVHTHFVEICMCDTCSIPFSGTGNSFPCTKSWLDAIWDHNWTFKHHLLSQGHSNSIHTSWTWYVWQALFKPFYMITNLSTCVKAWYNAICNYSSQYKDHDNGVSRSCQGHSFISIMHGIWLVAYMCDTCSIPFSGTGNSCPFFKSW